MDVEQICKSRHENRLFERHPRPILFPAGDTPYSRAKQLEFAGDLAGAVVLYMEAMRSGERVDSAMKDIAGILNSVGRAKEAVAFLRVNEHLVSNKVGYKNLLARYESDDFRDLDGLKLDRGVLCTVRDPSLGPVTMELCGRLFPNPGKIQRILYLAGDDKEIDGLIAVVHFASHSAARKALGVRKLMRDVYLHQAQEPEELVLCELEQLETSPTGKDSAIIAITSKTRPEELAALCDRSNTPIYSYRHDPLVRKIADAVALEFVQDLPSTTAIAAAAAAAAPAAAEVVVQPEVDALLPYVAELPPNSGACGTACIVFPLAGYAVNQVPRDQLFLLDVVIATAEVLRDAIHLQQRQDQVAVAEAPHEEESPSPIPHEDSPPVYYTPSPVLDRLVRTWN